MCGSLDVCQESQSCKNIYWPGWNFLDDKGGVCRVRAAALTDFAPGDSVVINSCTLTQTQEVPIFFHLPPPLLLKINGWTSFNGSLHKASARFGTLDLHVRVIKALPAALISVASGAVMEILILPTRHSEPPPLAPPTMPPCWRNCAGMAALTEMVG